MLMSYSSEVTEMNVNNNGFKVEKQWREYCLDPSEATGQQYGSSRHKQWIFCVNQEYFLVF